MSAGGGGARGASGSVVRAVRLPPAEAMRPEPPVGLRADDLRTARPRPVRAAHRADGRAAARAAPDQDGVLDARHFAGRGGAGDRQLLPGLDRLHDERPVSLGAAVRHVGDARPRPSATGPCTSWPACRACCDASRTASVSARLRAGPRSRRVGIMGIRPDNELFGLVNMDGRETPLPPHGLLVSEEAGRGAAT